MPSAKRFGTRPRWRSSDRQRTYYVADCPDESDGEAAPLVIGRSGLPHAGLKSTWVGDPAVRADVDAPATADGRLAANLPSDHNRYGLIRSCSRRHAACGY